MKQITHIERLQAIEQQFLAEHLLLTEQNRHKGEQDGRRNLPAVEDDMIPPQELQVLAQYQAKIEEINGAVRQMLQDIKNNKWQPAVTALQNWTPEWSSQMVQQALEIRNRRLDESAANHFDRLKVIENTPSYSRAKEAIESAENRLHAAANQVGRYELHHKINPFWAIFIAVTIGLLEVPLNYQTFLLFHEKALMTLLLSLSLVVIMPIIAHSCGRLYRQGNERPSYYIIASALTLGVGILSYFAGQMRALAIGNSAPTVSASFFFMVNILFFAAACMASFLAHDPSAALSDAHRALKQERRRHARTLAKFEADIRKETDRFQQEKEDIQREFSQTETAAQNSFTTIHQNVHEAAAVYNQILCIGQGIEKALQNYSHTTILCRREENLKFRTNHAQPKSWKTPLPELKLSLHQIEEITWSSS